MGFWSKGCYHSHYERNIAYPEQNYAKNSSYKVDDIYNEVIDSRFEEEQFLLNKGGEISGRDESEKGPGACHVAPSRSWLEEPELRLSFLSF